MGMIFVDRLEKRRTKRRRQRQSHQRGECDGDDHRHRELSIDDAHGARKERHRHKDRHENKCDADDRAADLAHRLARRILRRQAFFGHDAFDIFDHDDRIVHDDADRQHHAEHRQHVDRVTAQQKRGAGAEQCDGHDDGRNEGVADVLQEQEHHNEHQHHRLDQGHEDLLDRCFHHRRDVVGNVVRDVGREKARQLFHLVAHGTCRRQRVAGRRHQHRQARCRLAVQPRGVLIA